MSDFCPTFHGYIDTLQDALIVVSNVLYGVLPLVHRRPHDYEKLTILGSGTVFVFNKNKVRIKRWTDSWQWSPSRQIDDFFVYRERKSNTLRNVKCGKARRTSHQTSPSDLHRTRLRRSMYGCLTEGPNFKVDGHLKKTFSIILNNKEKMELVAYYKADEVESGCLLRPTEMPELRDRPLHPLLDCSLANLKRPPRTESGSDGLLRFSTSPDSRANPDPRSPARRSRASRRSRSAPTLSLDTRRLAPPASPPASLLLSPVSDSGSDGSAASLLSGSSPGLAFPLVRGAALAPAWSPPVWDAAYTDYYAAAGSAPALVSPVDAWAQWTPPVDAFPIPHSGAYAFQPAPCAAGGAFGEPVWAALQQGMADLAILDVDPMMLGDGTPWNPPEAAFDSGYGLGWGMSSARAV